MSKFMYCIAGLSLFLAGCSQEPLYEGQPESDSRSVTAGVRSVSDEFASGVLFVKVSPAMSRELGLVSSNGVVALSRAPRQLSVSIAKVNATGFERLFPVDPRFEKRKHKAGLDRWYVVRFPDAQDINASYSILKGNAQFEVVQRVNLASLPEQKAVPASILQTRADSRMPFDDPFLPAQWHYQNFGTYPNSVAGADINLFEAWKTTTGKPNVIVSVVDGGIDVTHEDLVDNLWTNEGEIPGNNIDDDGNGFVDDIHGYNFVSNTGKITLDDAGHGTHVAGTIAARTNNGIGVAGVAGGDGTPGSGARLMSCQAYEGNKSMNHEQAIVYGADNGAVISQNSWGYAYPGYGGMPESMKAAIDYFIKYAGCDDDGNQFPDSPMKGGVVIFAAGNDGINYLSYPGAYEPVIAVAAMAPDWKRAYYSTIGEWVDITAPGGDKNYTYGQIYSTVPPSIYNGEKYAYFEGTSMACPHVSGIAALIVSELGGPGFTNDELKQRLVNSLRPENVNLHNPDYSGLMGAGYIDAGQAFAVNGGVHPDKVGKITVEPSVVALKLSWKAVADEDDGLPVKYYVYHSENPVTAQNYKDLEPASVSAVGFKVGDEISYTISGLKPDKKYYIGVVAVDRWLQESELATGEGKTAVNHNPVISGIPEKLVRISGKEIARIKLKATDEDNQPMSYQLSGERRGVSSNSESDGTLTIQIRAAAPVGRYTLQVIVSDSVGGYAVADIPFEVYEYSAPVQTKPLEDLIVGKGKESEVKDLSGYFSHKDSGRALTFDAVSSNTAIVNVSVNGNILTVKGVAEGTATVTVTATDGVNKVVGGFDIRVVGDIGDLVYSMYPIPATTELNVLMNSAVARVRMKVRTLMGEQVLDRSFITDGVSPVKLDVSGLSAGTYTLYVESDKGNVRKTFVKQ